MKQLLHYSSLCIMIVFAVSSCKSPVPEQTKYIPKDASFVLDFNSKSLSDKCASGNINFDSLIRDITEIDKEASLKGEKEWTDFKNSGVDLDNHIFMFSQNSGSIISGQSTVIGLVALMKDKTKFEAYIKNHPELGTQQKGSSFSYVAAENELSVGWNDKIVIAVFEEKIYSQNSDDNNGDKSKTAAAQTLAKLFALKDADAVTSIPEFRELTQQTADMFMWTNSSGMFNSIPLLGLSKFADLFKGSYSATYLTFENGKITANSVSYSGKELAEILKKNAGPVLNMDMVNSYPFPAQGFAVFSFKPQIILDLIKFGNLESLVGEALKESGFTAEDITKAFKGDFAVVFSGLGMQQQSYEYDGRKINMRAPAGKILINAAIGDRASYDKIVKALANAGLMMEQNGQYIPKDIGGFTWNMDGKNLVITNDNALAEAYKSGKGKASVPADVADKMKGKALGFYVNISSILQAFPDDTTSMMRRTLNHSKNVFKDISASTENFDGKSVKGNFELRFINDKENSLVTLIKFISSAAKDVGEEINERNEHGMTDMDSMMIPEPPAEEPAK